MLYRVFARDVQELVYESGFLKNRAVDFNGNIIDYRDDIVVDYSSFDVKDTVQSIISDTQLDFEKYMNKPEYIDNEIDETDELDTILE